MKNSKNELFELKDHITLDFPEMPDFGHQETTLGIHRVSKNGVNLVGTVQAIWDGNKLLIPKSVLLPDLIGDKQREVKK